MAGLLWYRSYMDSLANTSGYYPDIHAGHADRTSELTLTVPYLSMSVPSGYNQLELAQIIGGTMVVEGSLQSVEATSHVSKDGHGNVISTTAFDSVTLRGITETVDGILSYNGDTYDPDGTITRKYAEVALSDLTWTLSGQAASNFTAVVPDKAYRSGNVNLFICDKYELSTASLGSMANKSIRGRTDNNRIYVQDNSYADAASFSSAVTGSIVYELATQTTESAEPFTAVQTVEDGGTVEFVTGNNIPVGNVSVYRRA